MHDSGDAHEMKVDSNTTVEWSGWSACCTDCVQKLCNLL